MTMHPDDNNENYTDSTDSDGDVLLKAMKTLIRLE